MPNADSRDCKSTLIHILEIYTTKSRIAYTTSSNSESPHRLDILQRNTLDNHSQFLWI